ncbi:MAG: glycosyltransferase family 2 protein [Clostridiales bacterium]|nr:glycosyltransferase family 2 protein [Clostridiales bacterium]
MLSVVIPAYNEQDNIQNTTKVISNILNNEKIDFEILFIDDGSIDKTWELIESICTEKIKGLKFSRNFGKEGAIFAGLSNAKGDCVAVIDCDLQHPPELLIQMYRLWENGAKVVEAVKSSRGKESLLYKLFAKSFYKMLQSSSGIDLKNASDYKLMDRAVVDAINTMPERITFFRALSSWVGFETVKVEFEVAPRANGTTKWNFKKLFVFAVKSITSFTNMPMHFMTVMGLIFMVFSVGLGIHTLINFFSGQALEGFSTVILLLLIIGSIIMIGLGVIGFYLSKIYEEIKFRPRYIISKMTTVKKQKEENVSGKLR